MTVRLEACPVCRAALEGAPDTCPQCSSDLRIYYSLGERSAELVHVAREQLARGDASTAREVVTRLPQLVGNPGEEFHALAATLAMYDRNVELAARHAEQADAITRADLEQRIQLIWHLRQDAQEQYNYALTAARAGRVGVAARHLKSAVELAPDEARLWKLKIKVDLKLGDWAEVYRDLRSLDLLNARPAAFANLERYLPELPDEAAA